MFAAGREFLHLRTVRFGGHAGTNAEAAYRTAAEIAADGGARPDRRHRPAAPRRRGDDEALLARHETRLRAVVYAAAREGSPRFRS